MDSTAIRVALLTDQTAVVKAFEAYSALETDMEIVGAVDDHGDELDSILAAQPNLIVLDGDLPEGMVFILVDKTRTSLPSIKTVFLVSDDTEEWIKRGIEMQTSTNDFQLPKSPLFDGLRAHIKRMTRSVAPPDRKAVGASASDQRERHDTSNSRQSPSCLTKRQLEILCHLALGYSVKEIASRLHLSPKSVDSHKSRIMRRLGIHDRVLLARYAIREGLVQA